jgi:CzcA family heavy metal efflux pump
VKVAALASRYRAPLYVFTAFLALAGIASLRSLPSAIYPEVAYPRIVVVARSPTFEAMEMTVAVTRPVEEAMSGLIGLRRIRSRTVRGSAEISLDFRAGADMPFALQQVQGRLGPLQGTLPSGVELSAQRLTPALFPIIQYELTGASPVELRDLATYQIRPRLVGLPDVGTVEVQGGLVREIAVELDPIRLVNHGIAVPEVADAIASANVLTAAGRVDAEYRQLGVLVGGLTPTPAAVGNIVLPRRGGAPVRVADLGNVRYGVEDRFQIIAGNGLPAALINVARQPAGNAITVQTAVAATVDSLRQHLPAGVRLELVYDQAALVRESLATVRDAMLVGATLAILILFGFLGRWRSTAVAALSLPLAVLGTFVGLRLTGQSLNLMSMGGLAVAIGLIIDDAVVIVENIERRLAEDRGADRAATVHRAADELFGPVAGSTLTTIVVFTPLGLLEGVVGDFFRAFSLALAVAVALSLVLAVTLIPALLASSTGHGEATAPPPRAAAVAAAVERRYLTLVGAALRHPRRSLLAAGGLALLALTLAYGMPTGFLPEMDEGGFILDYWAPTGTALAETDRQVGQIEAVLREDPDVQAFSRRTGLELGFAATSPSRGDITVLLKPRRDRHASAEEVIARVRGRLERQVPGIRVEFVQILQDIIGDLAGAPEPVEIKLFSPDHATAEAAARTVAGAVEGTPGLVDLFNGVPGPASVLRVDIDPARASRLGLSVLDVGAQARAGLFGAPAGFAREADRLVPIRARLPDSVRLPTAAALAIPIIGAAGWSPLSALGTVRERNEPSDLLRDNLRPLVIVTGRVGGASLGSVMREVRRRLARVSLPAGVSLELGGQFAAQQRAFRQLLGVLLLAAAAVFVVLVAQFRSVRGPVLLLLAAPLGASGAFGALTLTGVPFNISSFMGMILLVGLVVKNGIILLDAARRIRAEGRSAEDSVFEACRLRLRPILMTTLCTLAGLLPLALGWGAGAALQRPLAIAVIGGLMVSTAVTLVLLPAALLAAGALEAARP